MEIKFIRHGPPEFDSSRWLHQADLKNLLAEYRESRVFMDAPDELLSSLSSYNEGAVVCSTVARSINSARALGYPKEFGIWSWTKQVFLARDIGACLSHIEKQSLRSGLHGSLDTAEMPTLINQPC